MAEETTDASNTEQLVLSVRLVGMSLVAHEDYKEYRGKYNHERIKDTLLRLDLPLTRLRGQCYDMAASIAELKSGVAKQL